MCDYRRGTTRYGGAGDHPRIRKGPEHGIAEREIGADLLATNFFRGTRRAARGNCATVERSANVRNDARASKAIESLIALIIVYRCRYSYMGEIGRFIKIRVRDRYL